MPDSYSGPDIRPRLLLVGEDSVHTLYGMFESGDYEVLAASNGTDGLVIYRHSSHPIELLVTDYTMPGMSGLELARECTRLNRELGVLYVLGSPPDEELQEELQRGRRGFLAKPFYARDLLRKARELLLTESSALVSAKR